MQNEQVKAIIVGMVKEVEKNRKMVRRDLRNANDVYPMLKGMLEGVKLAIDVLEPNTVHMELKTIDTVIYGLFVGMKDEKEKAEQTLKLALAMLEA